MLINLLKTGEMCLSNIRRISLFGGPGISKSTTAAYLFSSFKHISVTTNSGFTSELVQEYVKAWAYEKRCPSGFDQWFLFTQQVRAEELPLKNGVRYIITDSPLILNVFYARKYAVPGWQFLFGLALEFEKKYPSYNLLLERGDRQYVKSGRFETEEEAKDIDKELEEFLSTNNIVYKKVKSSSLKEREDLLFSVVGDLV